MQHLCGYYQSVDLNGVLTAINAIPDAILYVVGANIRVPGDLPFIGGAVRQTVAPTVSDCQVQTPSLRDVFYPSFLPVINTTDVTNGLREIPMNSANPLAVVGLEQMQFLLNTDDGAPQDHYGFVWLQDGPVAPVTGPIFSIRATAAAALVAGTWVNSQLTFGQSLPVGDYQVVGMRAIGTGLVAARLVFQGYPWRPGVLAVKVQTGGDCPQARMGASGLLGTFNNNVPPTVDCVGATGTTQTLVLDLIKVA